MLFRFALISIKCRRDTCWLEFIAIYWLGTWQTSRTFRSLYATNGKETDAHRSHIRSVALSSWTFIVMLFMAHQQAHDVANFLSRLNNNALIWWTSLECQKGKGHSTAQHSIDWKVQINHNMDYDMTKHIDVVLAAMQGQFMLWAYLTASRFVFSCLNNQLQTRTKKQHTHTHTHFCTYMYVYIIKSKQRHC